MAICRTVYVVVSRSVSLRQFWPVEDVVGLHRSEVVRQTEFAVLREQVSTECERQSVTLLVLRCNVREKLQVKRVMPPRNDASARKDAKRVGARLWLRACLWVEGSQEAGPDAAKRLGSSCEAEDFA